MASGDLGVQGRSGSAWVVVSDRNPDELPSAARPVASVGNRVDEEDRNNRSFLPPNLAAQVQWDGVHTSAASTLQLLAGGDMQLGGGTSSTVLTLVSPGAATLSAGGDLRDVSLLAQHTQDTQVSSLHAGGSLIQGAGQPRHAGRARPAQPVGRAPSPTPGDSNGVGKPWATSTTPACRNAVPTCAWRPDLRTQVDLTNWWPVI